MTPSNQNRVYLAWLKSELYRMRQSLTSEEIGLIERANLNNQAENLKREDLLLNKFGRVAILQHVPKSEWHDVIIEENDLDRLYILAIWDWFVDTGRTFKLSEVPHNLTHHHGHRIANFPPAADHKKHIEEIAKSINDEVRDIIMISSSKSGPFTIIDGTHTAGLLVMNDKLTGINGYLAIANDLSQCVWAPEWSGYDNNIKELNRLVNQGYLW